MNPKYSVVIPVYNRPDEVMSCCRVCAVRYIKTLKWWS